MHSEETLGNQFRLLCNFQLETHSNQIWICAAKNLEESLEQYHLGEDPGSELQPKVVL